MRKKPTRKRPYFKMESAMTAILRDASGKMHHGILFDPPLVFTIMSLSILGIGIWLKSTMQHQSVIFHLIAYSYVSNA